MRTAPALVAAIDPYLWSATPTAADVEAGSSIRIDAPAGAAASYFYGYTDRMGLAPGAPNPLNPPRTGGFSGAPRRGETETVVTFKFTRSSRRPVAARGRAARGSTGRSSTSPGRP